MSSIHPPRINSFADRRDAGLALAGRLRHLAHEHPVVLALPRGGVPVAYEVARELGAPLDVLVACKIGAPGNPELGIGAVAEGGLCVVAEEVLRALPVSPAQLEEGVAAATREVRERVRRYRGDRPPLALEGKIAVIVDDGLATGGTALAAVRTARERGARRVVLAVPVGAHSTVRTLRAEADEVHCLLEPEPMWAIGLWYEDFAQIPDRLVAELLGTGGEAAGGDGQPGGERRSGEQEQEVRIPYQPGLELVGDLALGASPAGLVLFAHGSGSSRRSPRNRQVARALNEGGFATLLFDLLTPAEELGREKVFDIQLLALRLAAATRWAGGQPQLRQLPLGYFGASTGAAAALWAAADLGADVHAVVSRGGRPDLALGRLREVSAPVLLIVGGADRAVLDLNRRALEELGSHGELRVVPGATHLFEEPGALEEVARLAVQWFASHLNGREE